MAKTLANAQLYQVVSVDGDRLTFEARTVTDELVDSFELRKVRDGSSTLIEK